MQKKSGKGNGGKDKKKMQMEDEVLQPHKRRNEEQFTAENNQRSSFKGSMGSSNSRCKSPDLSCHEALYRPRKFQVKEKSVDSEHEYEGPFTLLFSLRSVLEWRFSACHGSYAIHNSAQTIQDT